MLAQLAKGKMRAKIPDLTEALTGHFDDHHEVLVGQMLGRLRHIHDGLAALDELIAIGMTRWAHELDLLMTIPGVGPKTSQVFIAETGGDMARFPTAEQLAAWVGVAPAMNESAGHRSPAGTRQGNKWLTSMLVEAATAASHTKNTYLGSQFARLASRRGRKRAAVAVAHSILVSAYYMLTRDEPYHDLGPQWFHHSDTQARTRRLVAQLQVLGHTVVLDPAS